MKINLYEVTPINKIPCICLSCLFRKEIFWYPPDRIILILSFALKKLKFSTREKKFKKNMLAIGR